MLKIKPCETTWDWCADCEQHVAWLELPAAVEFLSVSELPKKCVVHSSGSFVCSRSLLEHIQNIARFHATRIKDPMPGNW